jgi:microcystin degradation protein MlrC
MRRLRVAIGRFAQETHALSPLLTEVGDFARAQLVEGHALLATCGRFTAEVPGFLRDAELSGVVRELRRRGGADVEIVPLVGAWAVPGGPLSRACYAEIEGRMLAAIRRAGPLDAIVMSMHGAMGVDGVRDPESRFLERVRDAAGGARLAVTLDLHANLTAARVAVADVLVSYHTNPHRDHASTGARAARAVLRMLREGARPTPAWRSLPMVLGGGSTLDFWPPLRSVFARVRQIARMPGILDASVNTCHPWNDDPHLGWSTYVCADGDPARAERLADELAERCWEVRTRLPPRFATPEEAIERARRAWLRRKIGTVVFADVSDVVSAGAIGESTKLVRALVEGAPDLRSYVAVKDAEVAVEFADAPPGTRVNVRVGAKIDRRDDAPYALAATVRSTHVTGRFGRVVVLDAGRCSVCVTEHRPLVLAPAFYRDLGLDPLCADVCVVKNFFPFLLYFAPYMRDVVFVRTGGITDLDAALRLPMDGPIWPRDDVPDWRERDALRRGLGGATRVPRGDAAPAS